MGNLYDTFKTDSNLEEEGVWVQYGELDDGTRTRFRVRRMGKGNVHYTKAVEHRMKPYRRQMDTGTMDNKLADTIMMEIFIASILVEWEGVTDKNGDLMELSKENAVKLLTDLGDLYSDLIDAASKAAIFRESFLEEDAKK